MQKGRIERRGSGWYLMYRNPERDDSGKAIMRLRVKKLTDYTGGAEPPENVKALAAEILAPINATKMHAPDLLQMVPDFIERTYLPYCDSKRRAVTANNYRNLWKIVKPYTPAITLRECRTVHLQKAMDAMDAAKPRAKWTYAGIKFLLSGAFEYAIRQGILDSNPVNSVESPAGIPAKEPQPYTLDEVARMLAVLPEPARTVVLTAALTGMRKAEIMGLQWSDFQPDGTVLVQRSVWNGHVSPTKTRRSRAKVLIVPMLAAALEAHKERNGKTQWIFQGETGEPLRLDNLTPTFKPLLKKAQITWRGWHNFRRGAGTLLHSLGVADKTIQGILRHTRIQTTMDIYVSNDMKQVTAAMAKLEAALETAQARKLA